MKAYKLIFLGIAVVVAIGMNSCDNDDQEVSAASVPASVASTLNELFPKATGVQWEKQQQWYVADFNVNTFDTEAWFCADGAWAMTETDYDTMVSMLPVEVYNAFNDSQYGALTVDDATYSERPFNSFCVIEVEANDLQEIALFYDSMGNLINKTQSCDFSINPATDPTTIAF